MTKIYDIRMPKKARETRTIRVNLGTLMDLEAACLEAMTQRARTGQKIAAREFNETAKELGRIRTEETE